MSDRTSDAKGDDVFVQEQPWLAEYNLAGIARALTDIFPGRPDSRQARDRVGRLLLALKENQLAVVPTRGNLHRREEKP